MRKILSLVLGISLLCQNVSAMYVPTENIYTGTANLGGGGFASTDDMAVLSISNYGITSIASTDMFDEEITPEPEPDPDPTVQPEPVSGGTTGGTTGGSSGGGSRIGTVEEQLVIIAKEREQADEVLKAAAPEEPVAEKIAEKISAEIATETPQKTEEIVASVEILEPIDVQNPIIKEKVKIAEKKTVQEIKITENKSAEMPAENLYPASPEVYPTLAIELFPSWIWILIAICVILGVIYHHHTQYENNNKKSSRKRNTRK